MIAQNPSFEIWEHEVAGSNPVAPTSYFKGLRGRATQSCLRLDKSCRSSAPGADISLVLRDALELISGLRSHVGERDYNELVREIEDQHRGVGEAESGARAVSRVITRQSSQKATE